MKRIPARPVDVDQHLEEVDLCQIARPIRQRYEDLALPLAHVSYQSISTATVTDAALSAHGRDADRR